MAHSSSSSTVRMQQCAWAKRKSVLLFLVKNIWRLQPFQLSQAAKIWNRYERDVAGNESAWSRNSRQMIKVVRRVSKKIKVRQASRVRACATTYRKQ